MKTVTMDMSYDEYAKVIDAIDTYMPWGLISTRFNNRKNLAVFNFWDISYIPEKMMKFVRKPPNHDALLKKMNDSLDI